jgi:hypothetical protein
MELFNSHNFKFNVVDKFSDINFSNEQKNILNLPSNLEYILLCSNWEKLKYRIIDFNGTTNEEAIKKILTFYGHKTFRKHIDKYTVFDRLLPYLDNTVILSLERKIEDIIRI